MARLRSLIIPIALTALASCGGSEQQSSDSAADYIAVPRRQAYPRPDLYDSVYRTVTLPHGLTIDVNSGATLTVDTAKGWVTIDYPRYNAHIYCTLTTAADAAEYARAHANRMERMTLNAGSARARIEEMDLGNFHHLVASTPSARAIPLQFLASDGHSLLFSGQVVMDGVDAQAPLDSLAPIVDALHTDVMHLLPK